jgi:hypothetical protein
MSVLFDFHTDMAKDTDARGFIWVQDLNNLGT